MRQVMTGSPATLSGVREIDHNQQCINFTLIQELIKNYSSARTIVIQFT